MKKTKLRYTCNDPRNGRDRWYARKRINGKWKKERIRATMPAGGVPDQQFMDAYWKALAVLDGLATTKSPTPRESTFDWLVDQYYRSERFQSFDPATQRDKKGVLGRFCATVGPLPYKKFRQKDLIKSRDKRRNTPGAADKLVKYVRALFSWAIKEELADFNPAEGIEKLNSNSLGWHSWTRREIQQYRDFHQIGTKARLALELMLNTGARRSDAVRLGRQHEESGWLKWTAWKGRNKNPTTIEIPIRQALRGALDATDTGDLTYLVTESGAVFSIAGFGNKFRDWCTAAGLPHCSAHGLRKAAAAELAENGASATELMAIFGWSKMETAETYVKAANKKRQSGNAFARLDDYRNDESVSLSGPETVSETKTEKNRG